MTASGRTGTLTHGSHAQFSHKTSALQRHNRKVLTFQYTLPVVVVAHVRRCCSTVHRCRHRCQADRLHLHHCDTAPLASLSALVSHTYREPRRNSINMQPKLRRCCAELRACEGACRTRSYQQKACSQKKAGAHT